MGLSSTHTLQWNPSAPTSLRERNAWQFLQEEDGDVSVSCHASMEFDDIYHDDFVSIQPKREISLLTASP
jgi:hypothetical protein